MRRLGKRAASISLLLTLTVATGCSRPATVQGEASTRSDQPQVPSDGGGQGGTINTVHETAAETHHLEVRDLETEDSRPNSDQGIPFRDSNRLPSGTLLTVRLDKPLSAHALNATGTFNAIVDEDIVVDGVTMVPRGANAAGRIESAGASSVKRGRGYVRLTLATIEIAGLDLRVQTSSVFARANAGLGTNPDNLKSVRKSDNNSGDAIHLDKGRRLTFRLTGPFSVATDKSISGR